MIKERLSALGISARAASMKAGLGPDALRIILSGRSAMPRGDRLNAIADALDTTAVYLLGLSTNPERTYQSKVSLNKPFEATEAEADATFAKYWADAYGQICFDYVMKNVAEAEVSKYERLAKFADENDMPLIWVGMCSAFGRLQGSSLTTVISMLHISEYLSRDPQTNKLSDDECRPYLMLVLPSATDGQDSSTIRSRLFFRLLTAKTYLEAADERAGRAAVEALWNDLALAGERRDRAWPPVRAEETAE